MAKAREQAAIQNLRNALLSERAASRRLVQALRDATAAADQLRADLRAAQAAARLAETRCAVLERQLRRARAEAAALAAQPGQWAWPAPHGPDAAVAPAPHGLHDPAVPAPSPHGPNATAAATSHRPHAAPCSCPHAPPPLAGRKVAVIGSPGQLPIYRQAVQRMGGRFVFAPGREKLDLVRRAARKADVLLLAIPACSHTATGIAIAEATRRQIPVHALYTGGQAELERALRRGGA